MELVQFVDELLDALCREITRDIGDQGMQCNWVFRVLDMVSEAQSILWSLLVRLRELLSKQVLLMSIVLSVVLVFCFFF